MKRKPSTLELLLQVLAELYPLDKTSPGLVLAYLPDKNVFYGSICRYDGIASPSHPPDRQILASVQEPALADVINGLAELWLRRTPHSHEFMRQIKPLRKTHGKEKHKRNAEARRSVVRTTKTTRRRTGKEKQRKR